MPTISETWIRRIELFVVTLIVLFVTKGLVEKVKTHNTDLEYANLIDDYGEHLDNYEDETAKWDEMLSRLDSTVSKLEVKQDPLPAELSLLNERLNAIEYQQTNIIEGFKSMLKDEHCPTEVRNRFQDLLKSEE